MTELESIQVLHGRIIVDPIEISEQGDAKGKVIKVSTESGRTSEGEEWKRSNSIAEGSIVYYRHSVSYYGDNRILILSGKVYHVLDRGSIIAMLP